MATPLLALLAVLPWLSTDLQGAPPAYDPAAWELVQSTAVAAGDRAAPMSVFLLKSKKEAGRSGLGDPLRALNLLVLRGGTTLYRFRSLSPEVAREERCAFFVAESAKNGIVLRDVTNDGVPEIVFYSGAHGASRDVAAMHVLRYEPGKGAWREAKSFGLAAGSGPTSDFGWIILDGTTFGVEADSVEFVEGDPLHCTVCPKYFEYHVYRWQDAGKGGRGCFGLLGTFNGERATEDPIQGQWPFILDSLKKQHLAGRRPRPCP